jgi:hypothetical protein
LVFTNTSLPAGQPASNFNNVYLVPGTSGFFGQRGSTIYTSLANWQAGTGLDSNSLAVDPLFDNLGNADFSPTNPALDNLGTPIAAITTDINGALRSSSTPDMGAWEFTPPACIQPNNLAAAIYNVSATMSWAENGTATQWDLEYGLSGFVQGGGTLATVSDTFFTASGLQPLTDYDFYVRAICSSSDQSIWIGPFVFKTNCLQGLSGTYTLNHAQPTSGTNYQSFSDLANDLNNCGINGPVSINVTPGTYNSEFILGNVPGSSPTNTITINGNGATLEWLSTNDFQRATFRLDGTKHITVDSLHIRALGETTGQFGFAVQLLNGTEHVTFKNCTIEATTNSTSANFFYAFVCNSSNNNARATDLPLSASHLLLENNTIIGGAYGIAIVGTNTSTPISNIAIDNNVIRDFHFSGIYTSNVEDVSLTSNDISRANRTLLTIFYGIQAQNTSLNLQIIGNRIHSNSNADPNNPSTAAGIYLISATGASGKEVIVANNAIYNLNSNGTQYGVWFSSGNFLRFWHNTIVIDKIGTTFSERAAVYSTSNFNDVEFKNNNISFFSQSNSSFNGPLVFTNTSLPAGQPASNFNNVYLVPGTSGFFGRRGNTSYASLATWRSGTGLDANSHTLDPAFADIVAGDLSPTNSALERLGTPISNINTDINGAVRSLITPDIGAWEMRSCFLSGVYTVNSGQPTGIRNFNHFAALAYELDACGINGPVIINVAPGFYNSEFILGNVSGTSPTNTITINGNGATIEWNSINSNNQRATFRLDGTKYITIDSLRIKALGSSILAGETGYAVQLLNGTEHVTFKNCTIEATTNSTSTNFNAFVCNSSNTSPTTGNQPISASHLLLENNTIIGGYYGIAIVGTNASTPISNIAIDNNVIRDFYQTGIYTSNVEDVSLTSNDISRANRTLLATFYGIEARNTSRNLQIIGNRIHSNSNADPNNPSTAAGIYLISATGASGKEVIVANNAIYNLNSNGTQYGVLFSGDYLRFWHNTIVIDKTGGTSARAAVYSTSNFNDVEFKNNNISFFSQSTSTFVNGSLVFTNTSLPAGQPASNFNNVYLVPGTSGFFGQRGSTIYTSLANWQAGTGLDSNSLAVDPLFDNLGNADFSPTNPALDNLGTPIAAITTDINGALRSSSTPDMGAWEFTPPACIQPNNLAATIYNVSATMSWAENGTANQWDLEYGLNGFAQGGGTMITVSDTFFTASGLLPLTDYDFYVRARCSSSEQSIWVGPYSFKTICLQGLLGIYTLDPALPASGTNYQSFDALANDLNSCGVNGAVVINVAPGTYNSEFILENILETSPTNTITINGNGATLEWLSTNTNQRATFRLDGTKHITVDSLHIRALGENTQVSSGPVEYGHAVQLLNGTEHVTFRNCTIEATTNSISANFNAFVCNSSNWNAIATDQPLSAAHLLLENNTIIGGYYGITVFGTTVFGTNASTPISNIAIDNNVIRDFYQTGIYTSNVEDVSLTSNDISRANRTQLGTFYGIQAQQTSRNLQIIGNRIHSNSNADPNNPSTAAGIYLISATGASGKEVIVANNAIYNLNSNGTQYGVWFSGDYLRFWHNTIVIDKTGGTFSARAAVLSTSNFNDVEFKNNNISFFSQSTSTFVNGPLAFTNTLLPAGQPASNFNNVYLVPGTSGFFGQRGSSTNNYASLADWQTGTGLDSNSVAVDPLFDNLGNGDFSPTNPALDNLGTPIAAITTDINGALRSSSTPDMGAWEFTPPTCTQPSHLAASISNVSATMSWAENGTANQWDLEYGLSGFVQGGGTLVTISDTLYTATGLLPITDYDFYVRAICSSSNQSIWVGPYSFRTNCPQGLLGIYTLDPALPASGTNYQSFDALANDLNNCGVDSAVVINVAPGTYNSAFILGSVLGSSPTNTITINGNGAALEWLSTNDNQRATFRLDGTKHITVDSLHIRALGETTSQFGFAVQLLNGTEHVTFKNCTIEATTNSALPNFNAFVCNSSNTSAIATNQPLSATHLRLENSTIIGGYYGIAMVGLDANSPISNIHIENNTIRDFHRTGIYTSNVEDVSLTSNDISRANRTNLSTFFGIRTLNTSNLQIIGNKIHDNSNQNTSNAFGAYGIVLSNVIGSAGQEIIVANNAIYNINSDGVQYGIWVADSANFVRIWHNTIVIDKAGATNSSRAAIYGTNNFNDIEILNNNISFFSQSNSSFNGPLVFTNTSLPAGQPASDFNNVYLVPGTSGVFGRRGSSVFFQTLTEWQTGTGLDMNSVSIDPLFANSGNGDFSPTNPALDNLGTPIAILTTDINGATRSTSNPDMGAWEFEPPQCVEPNSLAASISNVSATMSWAENGTATQWDLEYGLNGFAQGGGTMITVSDTFFTANGLLPLTNYDFYARARCSSSDQSIWVGPHSFRTNCLQGLKGNYTVNHVLPTSGANYQSFVDLANDLNNCGVDSAVVIDVAPGTYNSEFILGSVLGSSPTNTITINGNGAALEWLSTNDNQRATFRLVGTKHITVDSLHIRALGGTTNHYGFAVQLLNGTEHVTFKNCTIEATTNSALPNFNAFVCNSSNTSATATNQPLSAAHLLLENNTIIGGYNGIAIVGTNASTPISNIAIDNNVIRDFYRTGIYTSNVEDVSLTSNDISRANRTLLGAFRGIDAQNTSLNLEIIGNRIHSNSNQNPNSTSGAIGINFSNATGAIGKEIIVANNAIYNINSGGNLNGILIAGSTSFVKIWHNTIVIDKVGETLAERSAIRATNNFSDIKLLNNNISFFSQSTNNTINGPLVFTNTALIGQQITSDFNNIYLVTGTNGFFGRQRNGYYTSLANWQSGTGLDINSVSVDPLFDNSGNADFSPTNPALDNLGTPIAAITTDINGAARSSSTPDMGAWEFTPPTCIQPNNLAATIYNVSATMSWAENGTANQWDLEYGLNGFVQGGGTLVTVSDTFLTADSLLPLTDYDFYVRAICSSSDQSIWVGPYSFKTICLQGLLGIYTLDPALPASGTNYQSFDALANDLNSCGVNGAVVINVAPGTYNSEFILENILETSPTNTITINGNGATLEWLSTNTNQRATFRLDGTKHITVDSLHIRALGENTQVSSGPVEYGHAVQLLNGTEHVTFKNCTIEATTNSTSTNFNAFVCNSSNTNATATDQPLSAAHLLLENNTIIGGYYGITVFGTTVFGTNASTPISNITIDNNVIRDFHLTGIYTSNVEDVSLTSNDISRANRTNLSTFFGIRTLNTSNLQIIGNKIHDNSNQDTSSAFAAYGIVLSNVIGSAGQEIIVANNAIYNINSDGVQYGIWVADSANFVRIWHNTIVINKVEVTNFERAAIIGTHNTNNNEFKNNNISFFSQSNHLEVNGPLVFTSSSLPTLQPASNFNNVYLVPGTSGFFGRKGTSYYQTLSDWQTQTNLDLNSHMIDPRFADLTAGDLTPTSFALDNLGTHVGIDFDINGTLRDSITPDIGAIEFEACSEDSVYFSETACDSFYWSETGLTYFASVIDSVILRNINGCDSIIYLDLEILPISTGTDIQVACDTFTWIDGITYTSSTTSAMHTLVGGAANGCDSVVTLILTINNSKTASLALSGCGFVQWNGVNYVANGQYQQVLQANNGCDSVLTLNVAVTPITGTRMAASACDDYTWATNGATYTMSGQYTHTVGCNTDTLDLTITPTTGSGLTIATCNSYTWSSNNQTYSTSGMYTHTVGCNIDTLYLTITPQVGSTLIESACGSYTWSITGMTYTTSRTIIEPNSCGADTLILTITPITGTRMTASACDAYTWATNGATYTMSGQYTHTVGCNTDTLDLTVTPSTSNNTSAVACDEYLWTINGMTYTAGGVYMHTVDCHTETLELTINQSSGSTTVISAQGSYTWAVNGQTYTQSNTYTNTGINAANCPHVDTLILTITPAGGNDCAGLTANIVYENMNPLYANAGASQSNTYYYGVSSGNMQVSLQGGVGPYTYQWSDSQNYGFRNNAVSGPRARIWFPDGPTWLKVVVTDLGNNGCQVEDSLFLDWIDLTCNRPLIWWYTMCHIPTQTTHCIQTTFAMRDSLRTGNWVFGNCGLKNDPSGFNQDISLKLYPLPTQKQIFLEFNRDMDQTTYLEILNLNGKIMYQTEFEKLESGQPHPLDVGFLSAGMYLLRISNLEFNAVKRFEVIR